MGISVTQLKSDAVVLGKGGYAMNGRKMEQILRVRRAQEQGDGLVWEAYISTGEKVKSTVKMIGYLGLGMMIMEPIISIVSGRTPLAVAVYESLKRGDDFFIHAAWMAAIWFALCIVMVQVAFAKGYYNRYGINELGAWSEKMIDLNNNSFMQGMQSIVNRLNRLAGYTSDQRPLSDTRDSATEWHELDAYEFDRMTLVISLKKWHLPMMKLYCTRDNYTQVLEFVERYVKKDDLSI